MSSLRQRLNDLATSFADSVLDAIRTASIDELTGQSSGGGRSRAARPAASAPAAAPAPRKRGGRLARRSASDIADVIESIVGLLRVNPRGLRAEEIRAKLGLQSKELPRPLKEGLDGGRLAKSGQKRATTYTLKGGGAAAGKARAGKRGGARAGAGRKK
ncbi:MAG TPA: hypothetical protein VIF09_10585 [Polyangiaceae bacterium]